MTPQEWTQIRRIARAEVRRALESASGGGLPQVWTNEVQIYNASLAKQGVRTLRGLAELVSGLQAASADAADSAVSVPLGEERAFGFDGGRLVSVQHGSELGADEAVVVRDTTLHYDERGRLESVEETWVHEGQPWGRSVVLGYDDAGMVALVVRSAPGPLEPVTVEAPSMDAMSEEEA